MDTLALTISDFSRRLLTPRLAALLAAFVLLLPVSGQCYEIIVVKTADLKPYEEVLQGVKDGCGCTVSVVKLSDEEGEEGILENGSPAAIVTIGTTAFKKTNSIRHLPLVYTMALPSETAQVLHPNISGVSMDISPARYLSTIRKTLPKAKRIGLLYDPVQTRAFVREAQKAASGSGFTLVTRTVSRASDVPAALGELQNKIDVFWMIPDLTVVTTESVEYLLTFSVRHSLPVFSFSRKYVEMGAVAALDIDPYDMGVQAGEIVKTVSAGRSGSMRVYARSSHLTLNRKVARKMGIVTGASKAREDSAP